MQEIIEGFRRTHLLELQYEDRAGPSSALGIWQGRKDSNPRMPESKSGALTNLATPLHRLPVPDRTPLFVAGTPTQQGMMFQIVALMYDPARWRRRQNQRCFDRCKYRTAGAGHSGL